MKGLPLGLYQGQYLRVVQPPFPKAVMPEAFDQRVVKVGGLEPAFVGFTDYLCDSETAQEFRGRANRAILGDRESPIPRRSSGLGSPNSPPWRLSPRF